MSAAHPGFASVQASIARRERISSKRAGAILASRTRKAGRSARRRNPRLNRVRGYSSGGMVNCPTCAGHTAGGQPCYHCGGYVPRGYSNGGMVRAVGRGQKKSVVTPGGNIRNELRGESARKLDIDQGRTFRRDYDHSDSQMGKYKVTEYNSD